MAASVCVGMSGGVDSSLAAALLVERELDVKGVYMRNWSRDLPGFDCPWAQDLADAERVAVALGIDFEVWDCEREYKEEVVDYLVQSYERGLTPNPDVMCNEKIKFGVFAQRAFAEGADFIATGHYARSDDCGRLLTSADSHKDQTYFLWRVGADALSRAIFPIGEIASKATVREMAAARGLEVSSKPDSQGICFVGPVGLRQFLLGQTPPRPGDVKDWDTGEVLGRHEGAFLYTVGQRHGLDLGGGPARYVVATDVESNVVYVTHDKECPALWTRKLRIIDAKWIAGTAPRAGRYRVRTRHTAPLAAATLTFDAVDAGEAGCANSATIAYDEPIRAVAPGQSAVIYDGEVCLGGGIVAAKPISRD